MHSCKARSDCIERISILEKAHLSMQVLESKLHHFKYKYLYISLSVCLICYWVDLCLPVKLIGEIKGSNNCYRK